MVDGGKMKKIKLYTAITLLTLITSLQNAHAALVDGSTLSFSPILTGGTFDSLPADGFGSWFSMEVQPGLFTITPVTSLNGLVLASTQLANPVPLAGNIDEPWAFFGNQGAHQTVSDSNVLTTSGDSATVDFSGWGITWNSIQNIDMSTGAWNGNAEGVANVACASGSACGNGASYTLDYSATTSSGDPSGYSSVRYALHLEGVISTVPVPASVWLFGSGLVCLISFVRRKI